MCIGPTGDVVIPLGAGWGWGVGGAIGGEVPFGGKGGCPTCVCVCVCVGGGGGGGEVPLEG